MTVGHVIGGALGVIVFVVSLATRPQIATCPVGSYVEGVGQGVGRPRGATHCEAVPDGPEEDCRGARACHGRPARWSVPIQIYCTNGQTPIVVDERTVGCQARH